MWNQNYEYDTNKLIYETETHRQRKQNMIIKGKRGYRGIK